MWELLALLRNVTTGELFMCLILLFLSSSEKLSRNANYVCASSNGYVLLVIFKDV